MKTKRPEIRFILSGAMTSKNHALDELNVNTAAWRKRLGIKRNPRG